MSATATVQGLFAFTAFAHYYGGTNIARCNGELASSTNSPEIAAQNAATKHFKKVCATLELSAGAYKAVTKRMAEGQYLVTFQINH
jgi:hypothetical protein